MQDLGPCLVARSRFFNSARAPSCVSTMAFPSLLGCTISHFFGGKRWSLSMRKGSKNVRIWQKAWRSSSLTMAVSFLPGLLKASPTHSYTTSQEKRTSPQLALSHDAEIYWAHESTSLSSCKSSPRVFNLCNREAKPKDDPSSKGKLQNQQTSAGVGKCPN